MPIGLHRLFQQKTLETKSKSRNRAPKITQLNKVTPKPQTIAESLITGYHEQALSQANAQFWFSAFAACVGIAWILSFALKVYLQSVAYAWYRTGCSSLSFFGTGI